MANERDELDERLDSVPDNLENQTQKFEPEVLRFAESQIDKFDYKNGAIVVNQANVSKGVLLSSAINQYVQSGQNEYIQAVTKYAAEFNVQRDLIYDYFKVIFSDFSEQSAYNQVVLNMQRQAVDLLTTSGLDANFKTPLTQLLNTSINSGITRQNLVQELSDFIIGNDQRLGTLLRHVKQIARDSFTVADRTLTLNVSNDLGFEFFIYAGSTVKDSRDFCVARAGKYYHKTEIQEWASLGQWQGRARNTNSTTIFQWAGGYNCLHSILPVDIAAVPQSVIDRAKAKGLIK